LRELQQRPVGDPVQRCREAWSIMRPFYVGHPEHVGKIGHWGFCELANERSMLLHWQQHILPTLQTLALTAADYARARMPALIIHGTRDRSAPYGGGLMWARSLPNARMLSIDGAGHVPHLEFSDQVSAALAVFLAGRWPQDAKDVGLR
jgi:pimeloyl-ACP methyl ester carboxylesterase